MKTLLSDKVYEVLKWLCVLALPAIAEIWNLPPGNEVNKTILAV